MATKPAVNPAPLGHSIPARKVRYEYPDSTPMAPPVGYKKQKSMSERVREMVVQHQLQMELARAGVETFEEANDFDIDDDFDQPLTSHEIRALEGEEVAIEAGIAQKLQQGPAGFAPTDEEVQNSLKKKKTSPTVDIPGKGSWSGGSFKDLVDWLRKAPKEDVDKLIKPEE